MHYDNLLSGSPLIPDRVFLLYGLSVFLIFLVCIYNAKKQKIQILFRSLIFFHGAILTCVILAILFWLTANPRVTGTSFQLASTSNIPAIEIRFNKPVRRKELIKSLNPEVPGVWIFEDPLYTTHLYRKVVFYSNTRLTPGTAYNISLSEIRNFLNNKSSIYTYNFKTPDVFDVLGETSFANLNNQSAIIGSFPVDGWEGINIDTTIRIRFNQPVDKILAKSHFSITPQATGLFTWDGDTMIFTPSHNLNFATKYIFTDQSYTASFITQPETTKLTVPANLQKYTLSCEAAALSMVLAYRGVDAGEDELLQKIGFDPNGKRGNIWGNPYVGFVGNVRGKQMVNGYGVYWEPIARAANNFRYSKSFENWTIKQLTESIQKSIPVIVWISINGRAPTIWITPSGDRIKAVPDEHTVVVTGFTGSPNNPKQIIVNDPLIGEAYWDRASFEKKWSSLSNSGVVVY